MGVQSVNQVTLGSTGVLWRRGQAWYWRDSLGWSKALSEAESIFPWGTPVIRHYKVKKEGAKYVIDVEDPVSCASLDAVVHYFVTHTKRALVPFLMEEDYEKVLGYVDADNENGENVWVSPSNRGSGDAPLHVATAGIGEEGPWTHSPSAHASCDACPIRAQTSRIELARSGPASLTNVPKPLPPVPVSVSNQDKLHPLPPLPQLPDQDESYVTPIDEVPAAEYMNQDVSPSSRPQVILKPKKLEKFPAKPPKPPIVPKPDLKAINGAWAKKLGGGSPQALSLVTRLGDVTAELQEKLQKRRALEH